MRGYAFCVALAVLILPSGEAGFYADDANDERYLRMKPPVSPRILSYSVTLRPMVGETVILPCEVRIPDEVSGNVSVVWEKMDRKYKFVAYVNTLEDDRFLLVNGTFLQIKDVVPTDSGNYACRIATYPEMRLTHSLRVKSRPNQSRQCSGKSEMWIDLGGDYCYLIGKDWSVKWMEAVSVCVLQGGSLATLQSMEELKKIQQYLKNADEKVHIGLWKHNDGCSDWVDKSSSTFRNWAPDEPSDRRETCVEMDLESGKWNDIPCSKEQGYICSSLKSHIAPVPDKVCPNSSSDWADYGTGYCYIIETYNETTWKGAAEICSAAGGLLATFHSVEEISAVTRRMGHYHHTLHIGLRQTSDGVFEWVDRSPADLDFWYYGEPHYIQDKCGEMNSVNGRWHNIPCDKRAGYVCSTPKVNPEISETEPSPDSAAEICGGVISGENDGTIQSKNYPENYGPNENCVWRIIVADNFKIHLNFKALRVEYGADCEFDYVQVFDGDSPDSPSLRKLCGSYNQQSVLSSGNRMVVKFSSDQMNQRSGFFAEFKAVPPCGGIIVAEQGVIQSRNYPYSYLGNDACVWKITVPESNAVLLKFEAFEIENSPDCVNDYVEILDGHEANSTLIRRYCGFHLPREIRTSGNKITVKFVSDASQEYFGFLAEFKKEPISYRTTPDMSRVHV